MSNMNDGFFDFQIDRLHKAFGEKTLSPERVKLIESVAFKVDQIIFKAVIDHFLLSSKYSPTPKEIIDGIYAELRNRGISIEYDKNNKNQENRQECSICKDVGFQACSYQKYGFVCYCECQIGLTQKRRHNYKHIPVKFDGFVNLGIKTDCVDLDWFVPTEARNIGQVIKEWKLLLIKSDEYWRLLLSENMSTSNFDKVGAKLSEDFTKFSYSIEKAITTNSTDLNFPLAINTLT